MAVLVEMKEASSECHGLGRRLYHAGAVSLFPVFLRMLSVQEPGRGPIPSSLIEPSADLVL